MIRDYSIKAFAEVTGISAHTLRYFDKIGLLCPKRKDNDYRVYSLQQASIAELILLLQKARLSNSEIRQLIEHYESSHTLEQLKINRSRLVTEIGELQDSLQRLDQHIDKMSKITQVKGNLYQPFIEKLPARNMGLIETDARDIVDLFDAGDSLIGDVEWPHYCVHGLQVYLKEVNGDDYLIQRMYVDHQSLRQHRSIEFAAGEYFCFYSDGSMERNSSVSRCINLARQQGELLDNYVIIEQVSGPVMEIDKKDFLVKIMLRIELAKNATIC